MEVHEINKTPVAYCQWVRMKTGWRCSVCGHFSREEVRRECGGSDGKPVKTETIRLRKTTPATGCKGCQNKAATGE